MTASLVAKAVPTVAVWSFPAVAASELGGTAGVYSTTSCAGFAPSLLEYCLRLVDVPFISKLNVPAALTTEVTSTLVQVLAVKFTAEPMRAPTAGLLLYVRPGSTQLLSVTWCSS